MLDDADKLLLQWGRGFSTAETRKCWVDLKCWIPASMGPRFFNRGNGVIIRVADIQQTGFNGAAVFQPRKQAIRGIGWRILKSFNGAAVFQPRKPAIRSRLPTISEDASMVPRFFNRGNSPMNAWFITEAG